MLVLNRECYDRMEAGSVPYLYRSVFFLRVLGLLGDDSSPTTTSTTTSSTTAEEKKLDERKIEEKKLDDVSSSSLSSSSSSSSSSLPVVSSGGRGSGVGDSRARWSVTDREECLSYIIFYQHQAKVKRQLLLLAQPPA